MLHCRTQFTMPHTIVSAHCRTQCCAQCRWTFWIAAQEIELFWHTLPHTIHNASHNCERTLPRTILNCRAGNGIILTLLQNFHNFSLSSVTSRAVNIYLQHVECVFEFKWLCFTVTNSISHDPSSIGCDNTATSSTTTIHTTLVLFASGKCWLSLFSFIYRNCVSWAPFYLPMYHQLKISLLFTVYSPSLWAVQWWSSCADYCPGDFQTHLLVFSTLVGNSRPRLKSV